MTHITIREQTTDDANALLIFDHGEEYPIIITDPFTEGEEGRLEWYFEQHHRFPFTNQVRAREAADSLTAYGEALFRQVFSDPDAYARYKAALQTGVENLAFEIAGPPDFHRLHWEALKDPGLPQPLALQAPIVRRNLTPQTIRAQVRSSPTINLLIVTARPGGPHDVGYRTISRPLVEGLRQAGTPVRVEILRPGTYASLVDHLEAIQDRYGTGFYQVVHFDVHGALLTYEQFQEGAETEQYMVQARYGRADIEPYDDHKAFLFLEGVQEGQSDPVEAQELSDLLIAHQIPIVILNACQSGKQARPEEVEDEKVEVRETSLGSRLMTAGVQMVLAMGYSVTVTAAELLMTTLYGQLFARKDLSAAICRARLELHSRKGRRAYFGQSIDLEDWLLPVVYQNKEQSLQVRDFSPEESAAYYERQAMLYSPPKVTYGFVGRDLDILNVERHLLTQSNILLIQGMGGAGKTTLLHHLAAWWQATGFVDRICYFGYDERAWNRQQIMADIAHELMGEAEYLRTFQPLSPQAQQAMLAERLRATRHLLILDNLESITGSHLAIQNTLPDDEQQCLHDFLTELAGGRSLVLLGSRGGEDWLASGTFEDSVYDLPGLDPEAASTLADRILERHHAAQYRQDEDFQRLLDLLDGYPLPMEVVLANLARQTPAQVLEALQSGDEAIDMRSESKTESIMRCIEYSHSNLSPDTQQLLACLAPFTSVVATQALEQYSFQLRQQPALAHLPLERWQEVLKEAADWGLLSPHADVPDFLRLQPILPYFLRSRLAAPEQAETRQAIETAFRLHYDMLGSSITQLLTAKEAQERQVGQVVAGLEYENLVTALNLALEGQVSMYGIYRAISEYWDMTQDHRRALEILDTVLVHLESYPSMTLSGQLGAEFVSVLDDIAARQLRLKQYEAAEASYQKALSLHLGVTIFEEKQKGILSAGIYHQLGMVAREQRQWEQAEQYYQQALDIKIEFKDRYSQVSTYQQLGMAAQEQRQWEQAEQYYQQALEIKIEFNDRHEQASTYHQLGMVAEEQRQWEQAEQCYKQALDIYIDFKDRYSQASTYQQLGNVALEQRQWVQAEQYYQQALEIYIKFKDRHAQAGTYFQLGRVAQEQRQWAQAEQYYQQTLEIYIEFKDRHAQAGTYHRLGIVAQEVRQQAQAEKHYQKALEIFVEFKDRHAQAGTYHQLGNVALEHRQWERAEQYYQQALEIYIEFNDRHAQTGTYHNLGMVAQEQRQWERAQEYLLKSLAITAEFKDELRQGITLRSLDRLWQASEDVGLPAAVAFILEVSPQMAEKMLRDVR
jgi:tetratricopeptide (TPR) repeat protein